MSTLSGSVMGEIPYKYRNAPIPGGGYVTGFAFHPKQPDILYARTDEYMFGPDLLVAPIMEEKVTERSVYLPVGATWTDANTKVTYQGGQRVPVPAPLDIIPVFMRDGKEYEICQ